MRLRSADPEDLPLVNPNYLGNPDDVRHLREGMRVARADPRRGAAQGRSSARRSCQAPALASDEALDEHVRRTVKTDYHPVGTCRMGSDDDLEAVVGPDLTVRGIDGLRVVDASVMPKLVTANTNAPTMAIADRAVSLMRGGA